MSIICPEKDYDCPYYCFSTQECLMIKEECCSPMEECEAFYGLTEDEISYYVEED